jgi:hypothetical protein
VAAARAARAAESTEGAMSRALSWLSRIAAGGTSA